MTAVVQPDGAVTGAVSPSLIPLVLNMACCAEQDEMNQNVDAAISRGYTAITPYLGTCAGAVSIVGSAPSLAQTYGLLKLLKADIFAINSSIKYLLERAIIPRWAMLWDAAEMVVDFAVPHPEVTYLVGARCHPYVFERLRGCKVVTWFAGGDHNIAHYMQMKKLNDPLINGGSAGVTRAMYLAAALGYRHEHIFGADSAYSEGKTHVNGSLAREKDFGVWLGNGPGKRYFRTTPEWCAQVNEFRDIYHMFRHPQIDIGIDVYGDGLLPQMAALMKARDKAGLLWDGDYAPHNPSEEFAKCFNPLTQLLERNNNVANARQ